METDDVFSQGLDDGDDPFALADSEFEQAREETVTEQPVAGIPVVNAEGQPVPTAPAVATPPPNSPAPQNAPVESAPVAATSEPEQPTPSADAQPVAPSEPASAQAPSAAQPHPDLGKTVGEVADEKEAAEARLRALDNAVAAGTETLAEAEAEEVAEDPPSAPTDGAPTASPAAPKPAVPVSPSTTASEPEAETKKKKAPSDKRRYLLLQPQGAGKWVELTWFEDKAGRIVEKGADGAKKTGSVLARGQEDALAVGYAVLGSPSDGVKLAAVAESYLQVKHVSPKEEPPPARVKLQIR